MASLYLCVILVSVLIATLLAEDVQDILVLDNFLSEKSIGNIRHLLSKDEQWFFENVQQEPEQVASSESERSAEKFGDKTHFWASKIDAKSLAKDSIWIEIKQKLASSLRINENALFVYDAEGHISGRGDAIPVRRNTCKQGEDWESNVAVIIFYISEWKKNDYGEVAVYNQQGDIVKAVYPMHGRTVIIPGCYGYIIKPPAMGNSKRLHTLTLLITNNKLLDSTESVMANHTDLLSERKSHRFFKALPSYYNVSNVSAAKYITRKYVTADGNSVFVFDEYLPYALVDALEETVTNSIYADNPPSPGSTDNVQWISAFEVDALIQTSFWAYVQNLLAFASGKPSFYPYDVSCNTIRSHDSTTVHKDCERDESEFTVLVYLNKNWDEDKHGETIFFADDQNSEILCAIKPKFGRVAVFNGAIPHSARPPTTLYHGARYTLAIKTAATKDIALSKIMKMDLDPLYNVLEIVSKEEAESIQRFIDEAMAGKKSSVEIEEMASRYEHLMDV